MTKLKTLKELRCKHIEVHKNNHKVKSFMLIEFELKQEVIRWIKALKKKEEDHWKKLDKYGYLKFPRTDKEDCEWFYFEGVCFASWHEASDISGAVKILKLIHNIGDEDLK